jgi:homopolymeric O-antigen transport system ATP-binding protein
MLSSNTRLTLEAEGLGKRYALGVGPARHDTLRDAIAGAFRKGERRAGAHEFWALRNVSFAIREGENVGIIGLNGAGKSTLLKILARIVEPTSGVARVRGRVGAMLEIGTGFHFELTGRENVFLYGSILGMPKAEVARKFDAIVDFAGVAEFIDTPVKRYSSGMYVRLAFAVAAHLEPDVLFIDEVLSVGDLPFQRKCIAFAKHLHEGRATILFVSHNMFSIKTMCNRALYLRRGEMVFDGPTDEAIELYEDDCRLSVVPWAGHAQEEFAINVTQFETFDVQGRRKAVFDYGERIGMRIAFHARRRIRNPSFIVAFVRSDGVACCNYSSELDGVQIEAVDGDGVVELETPPLCLVAEVYTVQVIVRESGFQRVVCAQVGSTVHVRHSVLDVHFGVFHEAARWTWEPGEASEPAFDRAASHG